MKKVVKESKPSSFEMCQEDDEVAGRQEREKRAFNNGKKMNKLEMAKESLK